MVLAAAGSAFAVWPVFQGNDNHDGKIVDEPPIATPTVISVQLPNTGNTSYTYSGVDTEAVMQTVGGNTYAYVLYDGYTVSGDEGGARIAKINCSAASGNYIVWTKRISPSSGFQLSTPLLVQGGDPYSESDDTIYAAVNGFSQLLDNPELYNHLADNAWTVNTGSDIIWNDGNVEIIGDNTALLSQEDVPFPTSSNRIAVGVAVSNDNPARSLDLVITFSVDSEEVVSRKFPDADQPEPLFNGNDNKYYYYLNENFDYSSSSGFETVELSVEVVQNPEETTVAVEYAELYEQLASVQKITELHQPIPNNVSIVPGVTGQLNTPITKYGNYLYFAGYSGDNYYYQYDLSASTLKHFKGENVFYWVGAIVVNVAGTDYVVFGGDNSGDSDTRGGYLYYRSVADFENTGGTYDLKNFLPASDDHVPGSVRSSISRDSKYLYFTSQGANPRVPMDRQGYIWRADIASLTNLDAETLKSIELTDAGGRASSSTSTPAISDNGVIYVGLYKSGSYSGGIAAFDQGSFTKLHSWNVTLPIVEIDGAVNINAVQASPVVWSDVVNETDYVYVTTNVSGGSGYCYSFDTRSLNAELVWEAPGDSYFALQGFASDNGYLVYGDDSDILYIFHQ
jgi:hypothetical protein